MTNIVNALDIPKKNPPTVLFSNLKYGDLFRWHKSTIPGRMIYMKCRYEGMDGYIVLSDPDCPGIIAHVFKAIPEYQKAEVIEV
jgi:hypothetical protein